jgi:hypothetical protein
MIIALVRNYLATTLPNVVSLLKALTFDNGMYEQCIFLQLVDSSAQAGLRSNVLVPKGIRLEVQIARVTSNPP